MILAWVIYDQMKWEKICKRDGCEPAVSMGERLGAYFFTFILPIIAGLLVR